MIDTNAILQEWTEWFEPIRADIVRKRITTDAYAKKLGIFGSNALPVSDGWLQSENSLYYYSTVDSFAHSTNDCPARIIMNNNKADGVSWFDVGFLHRETGPAIITGMEVSWFWRGENYTLSEWLEVSNLSDAEKVLLKMQYG